MLVNRAFAPKISNVPYFESIVSNLTKIWNDDFSRLFFQSSKDTIQVVISIIDQTPSSFLCLIYRKFQR